MDGNHASYVSFENPDILWAAAVPGLRCDPSEALERLSCSHVLDVRT
jgi:hypothetical protein